MNTVVKGARWLCSTVVGLWLKGYEFDPDSWQLRGERGSPLLLTLTQLYGLELPSSWVLFDCLFNTFVITDLVFADDAVIFAESLEVLVMALKALHKEAKPLGLQVSWTKTEVQVFGGLLDETVQSIMCVARTLISWTASNTLIAWSTTMVGHIKKS